MGKDSSIQWCHSSANWMMGCDGCELWNGTTILKCYAGRSSRNKEGMKGWPEKFEIPKLFLDRIEPTLKWGPPTDKERDAKPWIPSNYPRVIFLNDMGDTFSKKLPANWLAPFLPRMAESPHQFLVLTKRPSALRQMSERFPLPKNVWPGTTFTAAPTVNRIRELRLVQGGGPKFVSFEPLWSDVSIDALRDIDWAIFGGESGQEADRPTPCPIERINAALDLATLNGVRCFVKQLGSHVLQKGVRIRLNDFHGGDWDEWPEQLRVRDMPILESQPTLL